MPTRGQAIDRNQILMERAETAAARQMAAAYNQARRELIAQLLSTWTGNEVLTPTEAINLVRRLGLLGQINARLLQLERESGAILRDVVTSAEERGLDAVTRELSALPQEIIGDLRPFTRINTRMVEQFLPMALNDAQLATGALRLQLQREIQAGLLQGESFPNLVRRLMRSEREGEGPALFRNGATSAERAARRLVIHTENAARTDYLAQAKAGGIPALQKQAIAAIDSRTTDCCLQVHGQIRDIDQPFTLTGTPRFASEMMHPSFHWMCRTAVAAYHPRFERGGLTTANLRTSAAAELRKRGE